MFDEDRHSESRPPAAPRTAWSRMQPRLSVRHSGTAGLTQTRGGMCGGWWVQLIWFGVENGSFVLVLELCGSNMQSLLEYCGGRLSIKSVLNITDKLLIILESLHKQGAYTVPRHRERSATRSAIHPDWIVSGLCSAALSPVAQASSTATCVRRTSAWAGG